MHTLKVVMLVGLAIQLVPAAALFLFDDDKSLGDESESLLHQASGRGMLGPCRLFPQQSGVRRVGPFKRSCGYLRTPHVIEHVAVQ